MSQYLEGFGFMTEQTISIPVFSVVIEVISVVWLQGSMAMRVFWIGTIA